MPSNRRSPEGQPLLLVDWDIDEAVEANLDRAFLEAVLAEALRGSHIGERVQLGLTVTTDQGIQETNRGFRGKDEPTDVLSFPLLEYEAPEVPVRSFPLPPGEPVALGDIVVSYPRAVEQAHTYGHSLERELAFLLVHGVMHLLGYDHEEPSDQVAMRRQEEAVLERLGQTREA